MCFFTALGLFLYQSLDAIDGKQARRTNSSSPLGELFDHGCDSVSAGNFVLLINTFVLLFLRLFSVCHNCMLLFNTAWYSSMAYVLVLYVWLYCFLLCSLANICFGKTYIWKVSFSNNIWN